MVDIERLCRDYKIPSIESGHHHCHDGWIQLHCPQCAGGKGGWHLGYNLERGNFNCWRCGPIKVTDAIAGLLHLSRREDIYKVLKEYQKGEEPLAKKEKVDRRGPVPRPPGLAPLQAQHKKYLKRRGFDPDRIVDEWGALGTAHLSGEWNWRVVCPICEQEGQVVAYLGRSISDEAKPKYRMTRDEDVLVDPRSLLYGIHRVQRDAVVIVEGPTDVWRLGPGAVALLGIDWKKEQANRLRKFHRRYILFDPDDNAQQRADALANHLSLFEGETEIVTGLSTDPGDLSDRKAQKVMLRLGAGGYD